MISCWFLKKLQLGFSFHKCDYQLIFGLKVRKKKIPIIYLANFIELQSTT